MYRTNIQKLNFRSAINYFKLIEYGDWSMSMTHRERMLAAISGNMPDRIPYAPRIDTWYASRKATKTLPESYANYEMDDICRAEGWGLYKVTADYLYIKDSVEDIALTSLGLYAPPMPLSNSYFKTKLVSKLSKMVILYWLPIILQ